jgi:hypothetical protein
MKKAKTLFLITTGIIFIMEGVVPLLTIKSPMAVAGITGLGYPVYFVAYLSILKFLGGCALIIPAVPARVKEWAYAGYTFDFFSAFVSIWAVAGFGVPLLLPLVALVILFISYKQYHKLQAAK